MKGKRHSLLYLPGSNPRFLEKAVTVPCDAIIIDLEDSVSVDQKEVARNNAVNALTAWRQAGIDKELIVRINTFSSVLAYEDMKAVVPCGPDALIIPKADYSSMLSADMYLTALMGGEIDRIELIGLIETAKSLLDMPQTVRDVKHLGGFQFGSEDYTKDLEISRTEDNSEVLYAKSQMALICHAYGLDAIDTPYTDIKNTAGLIWEINQSRQIGMTGKTAIHPNQVETINSEFAPKEEELAAAKRMISAFEEALAQGKGSVSFEGKMIDAPIVERAKKVLQRAGM